MSCREYEKAKQTKQRMFFRSVCRIAENAKEVETISGRKYKQVVLNISQEALEEIREWGSEI